MSAGERAAGAGRAGLGGLGAHRRFIAAVAFALVAVGSAGVAAAQEDPTDALPAPLSDVPTDMEELNRFPQENHRIPVPLTDLEVENLDTDEGTGVNFLVGLSTPYAKEGDEVPQWARWHQLAGAVFPTREGDDPTRLIPGSVSSYDDNLFDVDFASGDLGLAGGSRCADPDPDADFKPGFAPDCRPIAYVYADTADRGKVWQPTELPHSDEPGYIGAIAWLDFTTALAVGGTGTYPRREPALGNDINGDPCEESDPAKGEPWGVHCDQAGMARAWLYRDGDWCELGRDQGCPELPAKMRGLTAVDFRFDLQTGEVLGFAGALGQIWRWQGIAGGSGSFDRPYDNESPQHHLDQSPDPTDRSEPDLFNYRVRDIRFTPIVGVLRAFAVTSGCCSANRQSAAVLVYSDKATDREGAADVPLSARWFLHSSVPSAGPTDAVPQGTDPTGLAQRRRLDSFYSVFALEPTNPLSFPVAPASFLSAAGGPPARGETPTSIQRCQSGKGSATKGSAVAADPRLTVADIPAKTELSTARLLAIDGPLPPGNLDECGQGPDWAVGELRAYEAPGHGRRGLTVAGRTSSHRTPPLTKPLTAEEISQGVAEEQADYRPTSERMVRDNRASLQFLTSSYTLNSVEMVGDSGEGWAVGDHGAILRLGGAAGEQGRASGEPLPPRLGARRGADLAESGFAEAPDPPSKVAPLPSLASRPQLALEEPELVNMGYPDATFRPADGSQTEDVGRIVMSRDGSEGWAIGPNPTESFDWGTTGNYGVASFYHYDGGSWTRCNPLGLRGQLDADPACAAVAGLRRWLGANERPLTTRLIGAARVPLESDADPSNDDELEIVAVGSQYRGPAQPADDDPVILRYRNGRWGFEDVKARAAVTSFVKVSSAGGSTVSFTGRLVLKDIAFTAPDDGWILGRNNVSGNVGDINELYHFDGERWQRCRLDEPKDALGVGTVYSPTDESLANCGAERIPAIEAATSAAGSDRQMRLVGAGERVYLYGGRAAGAGVGIGTVDDNVRPLVGISPFILYHERGGEWTDGQGPGEPGGGYDPRYRNPAPGTVGRIESLAVAEGPDGTWSGWAMGQFYDGELPLHNHREPAALAMRLDPGSGRWERARDQTIEDYMWPWPAMDAGVRMTEQQMLTMIAPTHGEPAALVGNSDSGRLFALDPGAGSWGLVDGGRPPDAIASGHREGMAGHYQAIAPDNQGGAWLAVKNQREGSAAGNNIWGQGGQVSFYRYTTRPPKPVFTDASHPLGDGEARLTALAGAPDGTLWAATDSSLLARYDRLAGWQTVQVPGWNAGRLVTNPSAVKALAVGPDGTGVAVGEEGRIARLDAGSVRLDPVAGVPCLSAPAEPDCGTTRDLSAAAVAPDGSALVGGDAMVALWRPAGGEFRRIANLPGGQTSSITSISMPAPDRAWVTMNSGRVLGGEMMAPGEWSWQVENRITSGPNKGLVLGAITPDTNLPLRSIAIDKDGNGYAVGDRGLVLQRRDDPEQPWRRLRGPGTDHLTTVTLGWGEGGGALIGGRNGVVWTALGSDIEVARPTDFFSFSPGEHERTELTGHVVGAALLPGVSEGQAEAWVALQARGRGTNRLLHYASDPDEPLLDPQTRAEPLADAPPPRTGELSFAAFGKADCQAPFFCLPMVGSSDTAEVVAGEIVTELEDATGPGGPAFSVFSGDAAYSTGVTGSIATPFHRTGDPLLPAAVVDLGLVTLQPRAFGARHSRRFAELVAAPLAAAGAPMLGAVGPGDLSRPDYSFITGATAERTKTGDNLAWRAGFERMAAPWGRGDEPVSAGGVELSEARGASDSAQYVEDVSVDPDADPDRQPLVQPIEVKGGARTHYAADVVRDGEPIARIVVVDSSLRSLAAADSVQQPLEIGGGQLEWTERMLCFRGQVAPSGGECTRERDQQAIVVSNTPTFTYATNLDPTQLAADGAALESLYLRYGVSVVVSGRLGWNGLYYALKPGLHAPCPGGEYPERPPRPGAPLCESTGGGIPLASPTGESPDPDSATGAARAAGVEAPKVADLTGELGGLGDEAGLVPFVVASGAGGKFGAQAEAQSGSAADGFWHGYTIVRLAADGDPRGMLVEQRPVFDWVGLHAPAHMLTANEDLRLRGEVRGPIGHSAGTGTSFARHFEVSSAAITHRYDLVYADPERPWLPLREVDASPAQIAASESSPPSVSDGPPNTGRQDDGCGPYVCLPERIGAVDHQSGEVRAGNGKYPDTFAIAVLSLGDRSATYPLMFQKSPAFVIEPLRLTAPVPEIPSAAPNPPAPPNPPSPPQPNVPNPSVPEIPAPPPVPPLAASQPPEPQPPAPPAPPPPIEQLSPLGLTLAPPSPMVATPTAVIQPPTPPVNPAPPGGARREARQRQAAAQKSGADNDESAEGESHQGDHTKASAGDLGMSRRDRTRPEPSFTAIARGDQPSAWAQGAIYTGGLTLMAFALAAGFSRGRPTPRRRPPEAPAPAWNRTRGRL